MSSPPVRIYFDFVDPLSYIASAVLSASPDAPTDGMLEWVGFEMVPPPAPLTGSDDPFWLARREEASKRAGEMGLRIDPPALVPWTRKAHELHALASERHMADEVRSAIFQAFFGEGLDIGRVDVLVEIAASVGLDRTEAKAILDVDRHQEDVLAARREALDAGVRDVPSHSVAGRVVEGFPDPADLGTLLPED
jgi:predicted DsbA family dithiol-disulfide isomerase